MKSIELFNFVIKYGKISMKYKRSERLSSISIHLCLQSCARTCALKPSTLKITNEANTLVPQFTNDTKRASLLQLFFTSLYEEYAITPPNPRPNEKKIWVAASRHTSGSLSRDIFKTEQYLGKNFRYGKIVVPPEWQTFLLSDAADRVRFQRKSN